MEWEDQCAFPYGDQSSMGTKWLKENQQIVMTRGCNQILGELVNVGTNIESHDMI